MEIVRGINLDGLELQMVGAGGSGSEEIAVGGFYDDIPSGYKLLIAPNREKDNEVIPIGSLPFWTAEEREKLVQEVIEAIGTPVFGRIDSDNNIILSGDLPTGTYTFKYENEGGGTTVIGTATVT